MGELAPKTYPLNLAGAPLVGATFNRRRVGAANLSGADLTRALAIGTNFSSVDLSNAILTDADLSDAKQRWPKKSEQVG